MALSKQFIKTRSVYKVTFTVPSTLAAGANQVLVLGDFNSWDPEQGIQLKKQKDDSYKGAAEFSGGREYQFKYLLDGENWVNDLAADKYVPAGVASEQNSVIVL